MARPLRRRLRAIAPSEILVSREGFEPSTKGLKVPYSATELPAHRKPTRLRAPSTISRPCWNAGLMQRRIILENSTLSGPASNAV